MKRKLGALTIVLAVATLAGCGIQAGYITSKVIEPERRYTVVTYCGKGCFVPVTHYDDEDYCLHLRDGEDEGYVCTSREHFDSVEVGDWVE